MKTYQYLGRGAFLPGVPARDLSEAEFAQLSPELQAECIQSGLYRPVDVKPVKEAVNG